MIVEIIAVAVAIIVKLILDVFFLSTATAKLFLERSRKNGWLFVVWLFNWLADMLFMVILIGAVIILL